MAGPALTPMGNNQGRDLSSQLGGGPGNIIEQLMKLVQAAGKYGLATVIFAFPVVVGCYGLYFLWLGVSGPQANMAKIGVGMFATVFGPALEILLLYVFTWLHLWEKLLNKEGPKTDPKTT